MRRTAWRVFLGLAALLTGAAAAREASADDKKGEGALVQLDNLKARAPADWKEEKPSNKMRFAQFRLPKTGDDQEDAELIIFKNLGGSAKENVERWKAQFTAPEGKSIDDVARVSEIKIAGLDATLLDISGIYLYKPRPFEEPNKVEKRPHYRMLAIHFKGPENLYHIKLTGPAKTVGHYKTGFDEWVKAFK
jgi:hypothetical protein